MAKPKTTKKKKGGTTTKASDLNPFREGSHRHHFFETVLSASKALSVDEITQLMKKQDHEVKRSTISSWLSHLKRKVEAVTVVVKDTDNGRQYRVTKK